MNTFKDNFEKFLSKFCGSSPINGGAVLLRIFTVAFDNYNSRKSERTEIIN